MSVKYFLIPSSIITGPDKYYGKVRPNDGLNLEDIIKEMKKLGTGSSESDMRAILHIFFDVVSDKVAEGNNVNLPIANFTTGISEAFVSRSDVFDPNLHIFKASISPGIMVNQKTRSVVPRKINQRIVTPQVFHFSDATSGIVDECLTPNSIGTIIGENFKFDPRNPEEGIFFLNGISTRVEVIANITEKKVTFSIPSLSPGDYSLEVRKVYKAQTEIRKGVFSKVLTVN